MVTHPDRYYVFSPKLGRMRVPDQHEQDLVAAIQYARSVNADNLVREEGPRSKITATTLMWERVTKPMAMVVYDDAGQAYSVNPAALTRIAA